MNKVKVLQVPLRNNRGGIASYILGNWRFIDRTKFTFDFITFQDQIDFKDELLAEGCNIHYVSCLPSVDKKRFYKEVHAILDGGYDAIHLHTSRWTGIEFEEIAMERSIPNVIVHSHSIDIAVSPEDTERYKLFTERHEDIKYKFMSDWKRYATCLCACSDMAARWLYGDVLTDSEVYLLKNAVDITGFAFRTDIRETYRSSLNLADSFVIGHVGRFERVKNHEFIIRVFKEIVKSFPSAHLLLIGGGLGFQKIKSLTEEYRIANNVSFLGFRRDIAELMQAMDVFVLPSLYEGLGIVLIEAQTAGLRCFASTATPPEAKILPDMRFLPLEESIWCSAILDAAQNGYERKDTSSIVEKAGYSIRDSVKVVEKLYCGHLKSEAGNVHK